MLLLYRFLWVASALGIIAAIVVLANPRNKRPVIAEAWSTVQQGSFIVEAPQEFYARRDALTQMGMNKPNSPVQLQDALHLERGARTGMRLALVTFRTDLQVGGDETAPATTPEQNAMRRLQRLHNTQLENLREAYANLRETGTHPTRVQNIPALRTDFTFTLTHPIPLFNMPVQGYLITVPVSEYEALHLIAYAPPHQFEAYRPVYQRMAESLRLNRSTTTANGGWE
ncbi:MAG: hypothetical protein WHT28_14215 [Fimbriimonadales bacterium]